MFSTIGKLIDKPFELTIHSIEKRLANFEPTTRPKDLFILLIMGIGIGLTTWGGYLLEGVLGKLFGLSSWLSWLHNPVTYLVPLMAFILVSLITLAARYVKDRKDLFVQLSEAKVQLSEISSNVKRLETFETLTINAIETVLNTSEDKPPFKKIMAALNPGNVDIINKLQSLNADTIKRLELLDQLSHLPDKIRDALRVFMSNNLMKEPWGRLYLTFAIKLQLEPWNNAARRNGFTFIRDFAEIRCFYESEDKAQVAFRKQLRDDLEEILALVNGSLYSVMYKDVKVWNEREYLSSNKNLFEEKKEKAQLKRLFVYEDAWLNSDEYLRPLIFGALWHKDSQYPSKFARLERVDNHVVDKLNPSFLASCLINETVIEMEKEEDKDSNPCRYKYKCDSAAGYVYQYKESFINAWEVAVGPAEFLTNLATDFTSIEEEYKLIIGKKELDVAG